MSQVSARPVRPPFCSPVHAASAQILWACNADTWRSVRTPGFVGEALVCWTRVVRTAPSYAFPCAIDAWIVSDPTGRSSDHPVRRRHPWSQKYGMSSTGVVLRDRRSGPVVVALPLVEEGCARCGYRVRELGNSACHRTANFRRPTAIGRWRRASGSGTPSRAVRRTGQRAPCPAPGACRRPRGTRAAGRDRVPAG